MIIFRLCVLIFFMPIFLCYYTLGFYWYQILRHFLWKNRKGRGPKSCFAQGPPLLSNDSMCNIFISVIFACNFDDLKKFSFGNNTLIKDTFSNSISHQYLSYSIDRWRNIPTLWHGTFSIIITLPLSNIGNIVSSHSWRSLPFTSSR